MSNEVFTCFSCSAEFRVSPEQEGRKVRCPKCSVTNSIPMGSLARQPAPAPETANDLSSSRMTTGKQDNQKYCSECGEVINVKAEICPKCGVRQARIVGMGHSAIQGRDKLTAALLALFLGGIGIHKFYLGKRGDGILYICLLFCFGVSLILALIDGIKLMSQDQESFDQQYNAGYESS